MGSSELLLQYLPTGFRFHPTDEELIAYYLVKKVLQPNLGGTVPITAQVDLNKCEPWDLPEKAKMGKEKEWYFFSLRDRKYPTGLRTNRATEAGYWKATGKDREIYTRTSCCNLVVVAGMKKTLVFYRGRAPTGVKTNWVMHEYRLEPKFAYHHLPASKDEWVISRVFQKTGTTGGGKKKRTLMINLKASDTPASASAPATASSDHQSNLDNIGSSSNKNKCSKEHVPCFSTILSSTGGGNVFMSPIDHNNNNNNNNNPFSYFPPPPPPPRMNNNPLMILESLGRMPTFVSDMNGGHYYEINAAGIGDHKFDPITWTN